METSEIGPGRFRVTHVPTGTSYDGETQDMRSECRRQRVLLADKIHPSPALVRAFLASRSMDIGDRLTEFRFERIRGAV